MDEITQIRVGRHLTGVIGFKRALAAAAEECKSSSDKAIGRMLADRLSQRNYIDPKIRHLYETAFIREYKRHSGEPFEQDRPGCIEIKVLGPGCQQCERLEREVMAAIAETGITAELDHVRNPAEIGRTGVLGTPALVIDGEVKAVGSVPPREKIKAWILQAAEQIKS